MFHYRSGPTFARLEPRLETIIVPTLIRLPKAMITDYTTAVEIFNIMISAILGAGRHRPKDLKFIFCQSPLERLAV